MSEMKNRDLSLPKVGDIISVAINPAKAARFTVTSEDNENVWISESEHEWPTDLGREKVNAEILTPGRIAIIRVTEGVLVGAAFLAKRSEGDPTKWIALDHAHAKAKIDSVAELDHTLTLRDVDIANIGDRVALTIDPAAVDLFKFEHAESPYRYALTTLLPGLPNDWCQVQCIGKVEARWRGNACQQHAMIRVVDGGEHGGDLVGQAFAAKLLKPDSDGWVAFAAAWTSRTTRVLTRLIT